MSQLFGDEDSDCEDKLNINTSYAANYDSWRGKEVLNKLKTKYGENFQDIEDSDHSDSSDDDDDEDENLVNEKYKKEFLETIACLKGKSSKIYDKNITFFPDDSTSRDDESDEKDGKKEKKEKPLYLRDYERKLITERNGKLSDSEEEENDFNSKNNKTNSLTYVEEQRRIKESITQALNDNDEDTNLLQVKSKSKDETSKEEESYKEWLKGQAVEPKNVDTEVLKPLRDYWTDPKLNSDEKFLRDYVLNERYRDNSNLNDDTVDWECRVHDSDEDLSADEENYEKQREFERKYNFRFEEPDQEFIKRYPRTMEDSLRRKDTKRSQKRAEVKQRKELEKLRQREELKQLKALKRKEIINKIAQLKEITGNDDIKLGEEDLEADFDPDEHDKKMQEIFNNEYYDAAEDNVKPEFPDIDEELGIESTWDDYDPNTDDIVDETHCEDEGFIMDADYQANISKNISEKIIQDELAGTSKKKRRRRSKFAELIAKKKPQFDANVHSSFKDYIDQYYALDYEDMIGDLPCRFKYRKVVPNDYGLTTAEILMADDRELNKWCSLKKALEHKSEQQELREVQQYKRKAQSEAVKRKILQSLYKPLDDEQDNDDNDDDTKIELPNPTESNVEIPKKKKRKRTKKNSAITSHTAESDEKVENFVIADNEKSNDDDDTSKPQVEQPQSKKQKIDKSISVTINSKKRKAAQIDEGLSKKKKRKAMFLERQREQRNKSMVTPISGITDERLKAFGINPRKFKNKLKYGKKSQ